MKFQMMFPEKKQHNFSYWKEYFQKGTIVPYFQPIISIESKTIIGYEVLARISFPDGITKTLGDFFFQIDDLETNKSSREIENLITLQKKVELEVREKALQKVASSPDFNEKIFLNFSPVLLSKMVDEDGHEKITSTTIEMVYNYGIDPSRIVIEITEDFVSKNLEFIRPVIESYKKNKFLIAIDDLGSKASNLDRIGMFNPDIIKVDMQMLKLSMKNRSYQEIIYTISRLGESLGISLLFEGIETIDELYKAMSSGSRYVQGFLFDKAMPEFAEKEKFTNVINYFISYFYKNKTSEIRQKILWEDHIESLLQNLELTADISDEGHIKEYEELFKIDSRIFRFYMTDIAGNQLSPNYTRKDSVVIMETSFINHNWSWRPYFLNHIYETYKNSDGWITSQPYHDLNEGIILRTFSKTFKADKIIFIDVLYDE